MRIALGIFAALILVGCGGPDMSPTSNVEELEKQLDEVYENPTEENWRSLIHFGDCPDDAAQQYVDKRIEMAKQFEGISRQMKLHPIGNGEELFRTSSLQLSAVPRFMIKVTNEDGTLNDSVIYGDVDGGFKILAGWDRE